jgi:large subunit ribosomal protein L24e
MEPGTGKLFVKKDGTVLSFDTNKCYKNMIELGRVPRRTPGPVLPRGRRI